MNKSQLIFEKPYISGIVTTVGKEVREFLKDAEIYGLTDKEALRLGKAVGLNERRVVNNKKTTTSDLCFQSAEYLMKSMKIDPQQISALIMVTQTPDYAAPSSAISLQHRLGMSTSSMAFDIRLGCSGFVYGLCVAYSLVQSGLNKVMLCVGDVASRLVPDNDHSITPIMGDAGSAILIESGCSKSYFQLYSDGSGEKALYVPNSGYRVADEDLDLKSFMKMDGAKVFNFTLERVPDMVDSLLKYSEKSASSLDFLVMHQPNKYILNNIQKRLGVDDSKFPKSTQSIYGNQNSASIPGTISGFLSDEYRSRKITSMFAGFGIGLSWGACVLETDHIFCPSVLIEGDFHG